MGSPKEWSDEVLAKSEESEEDELGVWVERLLLERLWYRTMDCPSTSSSMEDIIILSIVSYREARALRGARAMRIFLNAVIA